MHEKAKRSGKFVKQKQKIGKGKTWHFQTRGLLKITEILLIQHFALNFT